MAVWKVITGMVLGLILQLSQLHAGLAPCQQRSTTCQGSVSCHCCDTPKACHCAKSNESKPTPAPNLPEGKTIKLDPIAPNAREPLAFVSYIPPPARVIVAADAAGPTSYPGIALNVAFCRYVI